LRLRNEMKCFWFKSSAAAPIIGIVLNFNNMSEILLATVHRLWAQMLMTKLWRILRN
jgi:hypothetical protein